MEPIIFSWIFLRFGTLLIIVLIHEILNADKSNGIKNIISEKFDEKNTWDEILSKEPGENVRWSEIKQTWRSINK